MAITLDTVTTGKNTDGTPLTISTTVNAGSNRLLVVAVGQRSISQTVSGITFNSVALTKAIDVDSTAFDQASIWYLIAPDVTTANTVITFNAGTPVFFGAAVISLAGVAQSAPVDDTDSVGVGSDATPTEFAALTTVTDGCVVIDAVSINIGSLTMSAETNRVERANFAGSDGRAVGVSTIINKTTAGGVLMEWSYGSSASVAHVGAAFQPAVASNRFFILTHPA